MSDTRTRAPRRGLSRPTVLAAAIVAIVAALALPASGLGVRGTSNQA